MSCGFDWFPTAHQDSISTFESEGTLVVVPNHMLNPTAVQAPALGEEARQVVCQAVYDVALERGVFGGDVCR